ncbi:MAG: ribbon-helix-helix protein, CopG family [Bryobacteraceae bacterium]
MRITVTLEPDVLALIRAAMKERGVSLNEALNDAVRAGLARPRHQERRFVQRTFSLGSEQNFHWDKALASADAIEEKELLRTGNRRD